MRKDLILIIIRYSSFRIGGHNEGSVGSSLREQLSYLMLSIEMLSSVTFL